MSRSDHDRQLWSFRRGEGRYMRRKWQKRQRQALRKALHRQQEPEPVRTRGSIKYDLW